MPEVLMSFHYRNGWSVMFFDTDRRRTKLPRCAFYATDEGMVAFVQRCRGIPTLEDKNILEMQMRKNYGDVYLDLTPDQYQKLRGR
jgi:hypothetical protein